MEPILEDQSSCFDFHTSNHQKHVRFAEFPIICTASSFFRSTENDDCFSPFTAKPDQSCLKNDEDFPLNNHRDDDSSINFCSVFILIISLSFLFFIIWYTISKVLMLDVETQVGKNFLKRVSNKSPFRGHI